MTRYAFIDVLRVGLVRGRGVCTRRLGLRVCGPHRCHWAAGAVLGPLPH